MIRSSRKQTELISIYELKQFKNNGNSEGLIEYKAFEFHSSAAINIQDGST